MKKIILGMAFYFSSQHAMASSDYPVTHMTCNGFNEESQKYWSIDANGPELSQEEPPKSLTVTITNLEGKKLLSTVIRQAEGKKYDRIVRLEFYKANDTSTPANIEGLLTIENTQNFPATTRFVAHGWLAENPKLSSRAFDFTCELN